jgi:CDP-2,3-bis-(O-geranylgeranyl)-sn-glycerol synthase
MNFSDGRRTFGDGKTYRGLAAGILAGIALGLLQIRLYGMFGPGSLPEHTWISVTLLATGALLGDLCKSFFKRRFGKERGSRWPIADQYDLVVGALLLTLVVYPSWVLATITFPVLLFILVLTPVLHRTVNIIGYYMGVKEVPW